MMSSHVDVQLISTTHGDRPLPERVVDGTTYTVIPEGCCEYAVKVSFRKTAEGKWPFDKVKIGCYVDGVDCNYYKRLDFDALKTGHSATAFFKGYRTTGNDVRAFTFTRTVTDNNDAANAHMLTAGLGEVKVEVFSAAVVQSEIYENKAGMHSVPTGSRTVAGNKKFWQQASLNTSAGRSVQEKFEPIVKWVIRNKIPDAIIIKPYHSSSMLNMIETITSNKRKRVDPNAPKVTVDLTSDNESGDDNPDVDDEEIEEVEAPMRKVPMLDLTEDGEARALPDVEVGGSQGQVQG